MTYSPGGGRGDTLGSRDRAVAWGLGDWDGIDTGVKGGAFAEAYRGPGRGGVWMGLGWSRAGHGWGMARIGGA